MVETSTRKNFTVHEFGPEDVFNYRKRVILWQWVLVAEGKLKPTEISMRFKY